MTAHERFFDLAGNRAGDSSGAGGDAAGPAQLLAEAGWLRGLARSLTSDPELALELEQDTWRIALARPPRAGPGLRAWLSTVTANLLRRRRRDDLARRWHEAAASAPEAREEEATLERLELQARIVDAVRALPEPCRTAVTLRHLDGLAYCEVARRTHVDEAAARQRVSRGQKLLRARLDRSYGGRAAWGAVAFALGRDLPVPSSAALAAAGAGASGAAALPTILGGLGMAATIKLGAAVAAGVLVAGVWWWTAREPGEGARPERTAAAPEAESALALDREPDSLSALDTERAEVRSEVAPVLAASEPPAAAAPKLERITGIVLDARGAAVAGADVQLLRFAGRDYSTLDTKFASLGHLAERTRTGADGRFSLAAEADRRYALRASAEGYASTDRAGVFAGDDVELRVQAAASIYGFVLRPDDLPAIDAKVTLRPSARGQTLAPVFAQTDAAGAYRFERVDAGDYLLSVSSLEGATPDRSAVAVAAGDAQRVDFKLGRGIELRGRVTDAETGEPIADAEVCESWVFEKSVRTDADGRFVYADFPHERYVEISIRARGYGQRSVTVKGVFESAPSRTYFEVELAPAAVVSGRVVGEDGSPLESVYVACAASTFTDDGQQIDWRSTRTNDEGRYRIDDVRTDVPHALFLQRDGFGTAVFEIGVPRREHEVGDLVLRKGVAVSGTVVDPAGAPHAGAEVTLYGANADRTSRFDAPLSQDLDTYIAEREARTDSNGRFVFSDVADGDYKVVAFLPGTRDGIVDGEEQALEVAGEPVDAGRIVLAPGLAITGRVIDPDGEGASGVFVNAWPEDGTRGNGGSVLTRSDGSFALAGLAPGLYRLQFVPYEADEGRFLARALRPAVPAGTSGFVVQLADAADLRGRVIDADGAPVAGATVELIVPGEPGAHEQTNADGSFLFHPPRGAKVELVAHPRKADADSSLPFQYDPDPARAARVTGVDAERGDVVIVLPGPR